MNPDGTTYKQAYWVNSTLASEVEIEMGWYDATAYDEDESLVLLNSEPVKFGTGYVIGCANEGAGLVYSGQVCSDTQELSLVAGQNNYVGNCTPKDLTLGDLGANDSFVFANDTLVLLNADGTTFKQAYWVNETLASEVSIDPGWYDATAYDEDESLVLLNTESLPSGLGFVIGCANEGAGIILPSPVAK